MLRTYGNGLEPGLIGIYMILVRLNMHNPKCKRIGGWTKESKVEIILCRKKDRLEPKGRQESLEDANEIAKARGPMAKQYTLIGSQ